MINSNIISGQLNAAISQHGISGPTVAVLNTPLELAKTATKRLSRELHKRQLLNPEFNPEEVWAAVTYDGHVRVGTPLLHSGQGYYLKHNGNWVQA